MGALVLLVVLGTSIWVAVDASTIGVKKGQLKGVADMGVAGWFFTCLFLWILGFPFYLAKREELKRINQELRKNPVMKSGESLVSAPRPAAPAIQHDVQLTRSHRQVFEIKPP